MQESNFNVNANKKETVSSTRIKTTRNSTITSASKMGVRETIQTKHHKNKKSKSKNNASSNKTSRTTLFRNSEFAETLKHDLSCSALRKRWSRFWRSIPRLIWVLFIEACLVPLFRYEWGKYRQWDAWEELFLLPKPSRLNLSLNLNLNLDASAVDKMKERMYGHKVPRLIDPLNPPRHDHKNCEIIRINVGGRLFETQLRTIQRYPTTLLGDPMRRIVFFDPVKQYYFFDRQRESFEAILYFYQSGGRVVCPMSVNPDEFYNELEFFDIPEQYLRQFELDEGLDQEDELESVKLPKNMLQRKLWLLLEFPTSSSQATLVSILSVYVILLAVFIFCIETEPMFRIKENPWFTENDDDHDDEFCKTDLRDPFGIVETVCVIWFSLELILRFLTCPEKCKFFSSVMNVVDIVAILPYAVSWITWASTAEHHYERSSHIYITILRMVRLVRVFRVFKLSRHVNGLKVLGWTLKASFNELGLLMFFLLISVVVFSSAVYFAEEGEGSHFKSIPDAFYWAITTMTTVGYGDMVPQRVGGKIIGSLCAIAGVLTLALPVPVMVSNFTYFYNQEINRNRSIIEKLSPVHHVLMCPYLPNNGVHPDLIKEQQRAAEAEKLGKKILGHGDNPYFSDSDGSFIRLKKEKVKR